MLSIEQIQEIIPHRYPFIYIDRVIEVDIENKRVVALKNFSINEHFFAGHFPDNPVVPGVIMLEAMAQAAIILYASLKPEIAAKKPTYYFGKADVKFRNVVVPGDSLIIEIKAVKLIESLGIVEATAKVGEKTAVEATIGFGIKVTNH